MAFGMNDTAATGMMTPRRDLPVTAESAINPPLAPFFRRFYGSQNPSTDHQPIQPTRGQQSASVWYLRLLLPLRLSRRRRVTTG